MGAPTIVSSLVAELTCSRRHRERLREKKRWAHKEAISERKPIGIPHCEYNHWISALMQLILFLPSLSEMFVYTSYVLRPFIDFIDRYQRDQLASREISSQDARRLVEALRRKFPQRQLKKAPLFRVLEDLMQSVYPSEQEDRLEQSDLLALHPSWRLNLLDRDPFFERGIEEHLSQKWGFPPFGSPKELLLGYEGTMHPPLLGPQLLLFSERWSFELDAFVERRVEWDGSSSYITYLKMGCVWYQCDHSRVSALRSVNLPLALRKGVLFHYRCVV